MCLGRRQRRARLRPPLPAVAAGPPPQRAGGLRLPPRAARLGRPGPLLDAPPTHVAPRTSPPAVPAVVDPEAGVEFIPDPASVTAQDADFHKAKSEFEEAAAKLEAEAEAEGKRAESKIEDAHADAAAHGGGAHNATEHAGGAPQGGDGGRRRRLLRGL